MIIKGTVPCTSNNLLGKTFDKRFLEHATPLEVLDVTHLVRKLGKQTQMISSSLNQEGMFR